MGVPKGGITQRRNAKRTPSRRFALAALLRRGRCSTSGVVGERRRSRSYRHVGSIVGVDERPDALTELAGQACAERGVACVAVVAPGPNWPAASRAADCGVCHHWHQLADLPASPRPSEPRSRGVVVETGAHNHPHAARPAMAPLLGPRSASGTSAADALASSASWVVEPEVAIHDRPRTGWANLAEEAFVRKRCATVVAHAEVAEQLAKVFRCLPTRRGRSPGRSGLIGARRHEKIYGGRRTRGCGQHGESARPVVERAPASVAINIPAPCPRSQPVHRSRRARSQEAEVDGRRAQTADVANHRATLEPATAACLRMRSES